VQAQYRNVSTLPQALQLPSLNYAITKRADAPILAQLSVSRQRHIGRHTPAQLWAHNDKGAIR